LPIHRFRPSDIELRDDHAARLGPADFVTLIATVPDTATYGAAQVLDSRTYKLTEEPFRYSG